MSDEWTSESESEDDVIIETDESEDEEEVLKDDPPPEPPKLKRGRPAKPKPEKPAKRKMSEAQLAALARGRAKRDAGRLERKTERQKEAERKAAAKKQRQALMMERKVKKDAKEKVLEEAALILSSEDEWDEPKVKIAKQVTREYKQKGKGQKAPKKEVIKDEAPTMPQYVFY